MIAEIALRPTRYAAGLIKARAEGLHNLHLLDTFITARPDLSWQRPLAGLIGLCRVHLPVTGETVAGVCWNHPTAPF